MQKLINVQRQHVRGGRAPGRGPGDDFQKLCGRTRCNETGLWNAAVRNLTADGTIHSLEIPQKSLVRTTAATISAVYLMYLRYSR